MARDVRIADIFDSYAFSDEIEESFGVDIMAAEGDFDSIGDLEAYVIENLPPGAPSDGRCLSAMSFHRIRAALIASGATNAVTPRTILEDTGVTPRRLARALRREWGLVTPHLGVWIFGAVRFPRRMTVGDYAREIAGLNVKGFVTAGGRVRAADVRAAIRAVAASVTGGRLSEFDERSRFV